MRHAKAETFAAEDHARVLTERGRRDAVEAGIWLAARDCVPDHALLSTAARTRGTWDAVATGSRSTAEVHADASLYTAEPETALEVLRSAPADARTVMLVGHNPSMEELTEVLCGSSPAYPTAALGTVRLDVDRWVDVVANTGTLVDFFTPAGP